MIKNILLIFAFHLCTHCISQKTEKPMQQTSSSFENIDQLAGNWYQTKKTTFISGIVTNLKLQCYGKSFWEITNADSKHTLIKHFATGADCEIHRIKTSGLTFKNGYLSYLEGDIRKSESLEKVSDKSFKITEQSFGNGESILIENFYEKK